jgi:hypothetical protein
MRRQHPNQQVALALFLLASAAAGAELNSANPAVRDIVGEVSEDRIAATLKKLESFGTRNTMSPGAVAARQWIYDELRSYSPRLEVRFDSYKVRKQGRFPNDVELANVVAVLPGVKNPERRFIVSGHYDSLSLAPGKDWILKQAEAPAPGVDDDGSGTAAVLELARVMSRHEFDKTIVFIAFVAEEQGLVGASLYAEKARKQNELIDGVLNNDIIGTAAAGNGRVENGAVRVFSQEPSDSSSRELARYVREIGARYVPAMKVDLIFRADRFSRGGDHTPFHNEGYAAVRFTSANENYSHQHSPTDTFENVSTSYVTRVARVNAAALASLALAPKAPVVQRRLEEGERKGMLVPLLDRGKSGYDAHLKWIDDQPEADLAGYVVVERSTTAPDWEREVWVGKSNEYLMENVSVDDRIFGVKAVDRDGNESLVAPFTFEPFPKRPIETY